MLIQAILFFLLAAVGVLLIALGVAIGVRVGWVWGVEHERTYQEAREGKVGDA